MRRADADILGHGGAASRHGNEPYLVHGHFLTGQLKKTGLISGWTRRRHAKLLPVTEMYFVLWKDKQNASVCDYMTENTLLQFRGLSLSHAQATITPTHCTVEFSTGRNDPPPR